jgi:small-conductance mechanosensitive channel
MFGFGAIPLLWKGIGLLVIVGLVAGYHFTAVHKAYNRGEAAAQARCDDENLRAKLETLQRLADTQRRIIEADALAETERQAEIQSLQERTDVFEAENAEAERRADLAEREAIAAGATVVTRCRPDADTAGRVRRSWSQ